MFVVRCPEVHTERGERLVTERRIVGMAAAPDGWLLTVACPCGQQHVVAVPHLRDSALPAA